ncbi:MAG: hypothetical protein ACRDE8_11125, partial [Ginsengibacter sp.]
PKPPALSFKSFRINGDPLRTLDVTPNFARLTFSFSNPTGSAVEASPQVTTTNGTQITIPRDLITPLTRSVSLSGSRILDGSLYFLEHNNIHHYLQLQTLLSLLPRGGYLELDAGDYKDIDPRYTTYIYYRIKIFNSDGSAVSIGSTPVRVVQLDPSPPAQAY